MATTYGTGEAGFGKSARGVGTGKFTEFLKISANATASGTTATKCLPGVAVEFDTDDNSVKEFDGTGTVIGTLGYENTNINWRPANRDTAYNIGDIVAVEIGPSRRRMILADSMTIVKGDYLYVTADGHLSKATAGTHDVYADADESVTTSGGTAAIWVITRR